jgi:putative ABC transport system substrate-binding protein
LTAKARRFNTDKDVLGNAMRRRDFLGVLGCATLAHPFAAHAQQTERMRRIGVLMGLAEDDPDTKARLSAFRHELEKLRWVEGHDVRIDYRFAPAGARAEALAKELVALQPDVILSNASPATRALQRETRTIPIVFTGVSDPIGSGFIASLARPGRNITGPLLFEGDITGKWLATLKDIAPSLARVTLVINPKSAPYYEFYLRAEALLMMTSASSVAVFQPVFRSLGPKLGPSSFMAFCRKQESHKRSGRMR